MAGWDSGWMRRCWKSGRRMCIEITLECTSKKQNGLYYVGAAVLRGRITAEQMEAAATLSERHGSGELRTTNMQKHNCRECSGGESADPGRGVEPRGAFDGGVSVLAWSGGLHRN